MFVVAEIGTSHGGDFEKAKKLIDAAVWAGADAVKFQWVYADEILHPDTGFVKLPGGKVRLYDRFKELEVEPKFFADCLEYTHSKNVKFYCSPFGLRSLAELLAIKPDGIKIASPELNHIPLLKALVDARKNQQEKIPVILSSGVSTLADIERAVEIIGREKVTLLHCVTSYPAPEEDYNLNVIPNLSKIFGLPVGVSDHSLDPVLVPSLAASVGGEMIEKHITLSKKTDGLDDPVALEPEQFAQMCHCVHQCEAMINRYSLTCGGDNIIEQMLDQFGKEKVKATLGSGVKELAPAEKANYGRTNRSLHFMRSMKAGEKILSEDIGVLRTEKILSPGIGPEFLEEVTGAILTRDVSSGAGIQWKDFISK